ncbi:aminotransferase class I/II-fold pyridoxal phosphate-dependent enzyme [Pararhizobium arenae]|uniref:aminotransferase class I/II-fold pyridoxal phosphate-dependent enzyme n=1 Tax=Pararhizobium arenae TaxID=1856850 RepID=UPI000A677D85|nr:aminotransferase class I/II-fold pyridoxal phosphate-dependent enzyme [Pararhizobium arenae]
MTEAPAMRDFALEAYMSKWEFVARYNLTGSDAESLRLPDLLALANDGERAEFENLSLSYTQTYGAPALRAEISRTYDSTAPEDILCFAGAEEGIYIAMKVLLTADDHAIVITPNYQAAETIPLSICAVTGIALDENDDWSLDIDKVEAAIRPNTKLISINFPNNPTGKILPRKTFDALVTLCRKHGIWLFSDEVYRLIERTPELRLPQAVDVYERGISLNVMSKAYGLPGLRIGWIACKDRALLQRFERYKHYLSICNSAPSEVLARIALRNRETVLARTRGIVSNNIGLLNDFFADYSHIFDWKEPNGGCVAFIRYKGPDGVEAFTQKLVEEAGVFFLPSSVYRSDLGPVPQDRLRVGFGHLDLREGLSALGKYLMRNDRY